MWFDRWWGLLVGDDGVVGGLVDLADRRISGWQLV